MLTARARVAVAPLAGGAHGACRDAIRTGGIAPARVDRDRHSCRALAEPRRGRIPAGAGSPGSSAMSRPFRLALPSKGRMHAPAVELARAAGVEVEVNGRALYQHCSQWDIEVLFARSDDVPAWAADGAVETAVAGRNQLIESSTDALELLPLGFGRCRLELAVANASPVRRAADLNGARAGTRAPPPTP